MPEPQTVPDFAAMLAAHLRENRDAIAKRWLDRIAERVDLAQRDVFPTDDLLDHVPLLIDALADYVEDPTRETLSDGDVVGKAMELGEFRLSQGFGAAELLREYDDARSILFDEFTSVLDQGPGPVPERAGVLSYHRLFSGLATIERATAHRFLELSRHEVARNEQALRGFNRAVSHELKNRIGVIQNAWALLSDPDFSVDRQAYDRLETMLGTGIRGLGRVVDDLIQLSRTAGPAEPARQVRLPAAVQEVFDLFADLAAVRGVELIASEELPDACVPAALTELCLVNLVSNGIKYSDPAKERRYVRVSGSTSHATEELVIEVRDNGIGVPDEFRDRLFDRFSRPDEAQARAEGTGLGLSIVRETIESLGGRAWASLDRPGETAFLIALPIEA
jgi:signal transduction histidine kinase